MPARLVELARGDPDLGYPEWVDDALIELHVDWELRRWQEGHDPAAVLEGLRRLTWLVDVAIKQIRPAVVLTTNKIDHPCALFRKAAHHYRLAIGLIERSPFDSIWFESRGIFAESEIWSRVAGTGPRVEEDRRREQSLLDALVANPAGFRKAENTDTRPAMDNFAGPTVFVPFDNMLWTGWEQPQHPQGDVDYPIFRDPARALRTIKETVDRIGGRMVLKMHPACRMNMDFDQGIADCMVDGDLGYLLDAADVVVAFNTKLVFPALAGGTPAVTLAPNPVAASGATYHCTDEARLGDILQRALNLEDWPAKRKKFALFCESLDRSYFYSSRDDDAPRDGPSALANRLVTEALALDLEHDSESLQRGLGVVKQLAKGQRLATALPVKTARRAAKPKVLLEVNRLFAPGLVNSGITRYNRSLAHGLAQSLDVEVAFAVTAQPKLAPEEFTQLRGQVEEQLGQPAIFLVRDDVSEYVRSLNALGEYDIFHSTHGPLPPAKLPVARRRVITVHDVVHIKHPRFNPVPWRYPHISAVIKSVNPDRDWVICDSHYTRHDLVELLDVPPDRLRVVPLAVDDAYRSDPAREWLASEPDPEEPERKPFSYVVQIYQHDIRKNAEGSFAVLARALACNEGLTVLVVAGGADRVPDIRAMAARHGIAEEQLSIVCGVDDERLSRFLQEAVCLLYFSLYEGFGLPLLEGMASACPVVTTDVSSLPQAGGASAIYCDPNDRSSAVDAISLLYQDRGLRATWGRRGLAKSREATWDRVVDETIAVYEQMLS